MKVLIIGASGLVGGNCLKYLQKYEQYKVLGTHLSNPTEGTVYFNPCDLNDPNNASIEEFSPNIIIHCGALTFVDYCETHVEESYIKTVTSTRNILHLASNFQAKVIYISTDYVFDGKQGPYTENDLVNPLNIYGKHKLEGEKLITAASANNLILRVTNVYGDELRGKNFIARLIKQMSDGEEINLKLPFDQYATPINAYDIARASKLLIENDKAGLYHLGSTDFMNRIQLAERVIRKAGYTKFNLNAVSTEELGQIAARPLRGGLISHKFLDEFPNFYFTNVDDYINQKIYA